MYMFLILSSYILPLLTITSSSSSPKSFLSLSPSSHPPIPFYLPLSPPHLSSISSHHLYLPHLPSYFFSSFYFPSFYHRLFLKLSILSRSFQFPSFSYHSCISPSLPNLILPLSLFIYHIFPFNFPSSLNPSVCYSPSSHLCSPLPYPLFLPY